jgi:hypothetical protein
MLFLTIMAATKAISQSNGKFQFAISLHSNAPAHPSYEYNPYNREEANKQGYSIGLMGKFQKNDYIAFRLQTIFNKMTSTSTFNKVSFDGYRETFRDDAHQSVIKIFSGVQWGLSQGRVSTYGGLGLPVSLIGNLVYESKYKIFSPTDVQTYESRIKKNWPGGFSAGLGMFLGSNFSINQNLQIGVEFGTAYRYFSSKGKIVEEVNNTDTVNQGSSRTETKVKYREFGFDSLNGSLLLTYLF